MNRGISDYRLSEQEQYWKELHLGDADKTTVGHDLFSDQYKKQNISFPIKNEVIDKLKAVTKGNDLLTYVFFLTALNIELYKYTGNDEIVVGVPVYFSDKKRPLSIKNKELPFKSNINGTVNVKSFLMETKKKLLDVYENQYVDLVPTFRKLNMACTIAELTPVSITYNALHLEEDIEYVCSSYRNEITVCMEKNEAEDIEIVLVFNASLYEEETVTQFAKRFIQVLNEMLSDFNRSIRDVDLLTETQKNHILNDFNDTNVGCKAINKSIHELFESQAERTPDQIAMIFEDNEVTYKELNDKSNAFARKLRSKGVQPEDIVGVILERSIEMVAGILGILKSGAAYLPIDPKNPKDRIEYMLYDAQAKVLLSTPRLISDIEFAGTIIDAGDSGTFEGDVGRLERVNKPNDLAYVIYTSGTTGNPKGVMVEHKSLTQTMLFLKDDYQYNENNVVLPIINYAFDGFVLLFYTPLIAGSKVILVNNEEMVSPYKISELMKTCRVTDYFSVPSIYLTVLDYFSQEESISLRQVTLVGEELPVKAIEYTNRLNPDIEIVNRYGPSENTVETTAMRHVERHDKILIGKPIANTKVYIVDEDHNPLPIGVPGEICIGGSRLARGYLNRPELTKEKFIENPFEKGKRMYKTGDRAKWLPDGTIEFLGRKDDQVKIRGQRIELKEIENRLLRHPDVKEAVVYAEKNADLDQYIIAYVVGNTAIISDIKNYLKESLPHYMVPSYILQLDKMPLTNNGKIDFRSLPKPNINESVNFYTAPRNKIEKELALLWQEILGVDKVGIDDNFFDLGGHSLKANVFISKLHKNVNIELPIKELFMNPTIRAISSVINERTEKSYEMIPICQENVYYETSSAQKRMYMIQQLENGTAYNMPILFEVKGEVDPGKIEETFQKLVNRHDPLRTFFDEINGEIVQKIYPKRPFTMERRDRRGWTLEALTKEFVQPFELNKAPLFRVEIAELEETTYLMVDTHHIISDGVSVERLFSEFIELYNGQELEPLRIQYKDFAAWQNRFLKSDELKKQEEYWVQQFTGDIPVLNLPYDFERPLMQSFEGRHLSFALNEDQTEGLRGIAKKTGTTMHMVLLSAFYVLLSKYSGQEDLVVGTPVAGRPHADLQNMMGMFVNTLALRNKAEGEKSFLEFLEEVKQNSLLAYENQSYQFEDLIDKLEVNRDTSRHPLFDVMFNMSHAIQEDERVYKGLQLEQIQRESHISKFDLTLHITEQESTINGNIEYCTRLFKKETIERMALHFNEIVTSICRSDEAKLHQINMMTESEKHQILHEFNNTKTNYPREKNIVELFEEQAEKRPGYKAVVFENQHITYKDLNQKANQLAAALRKKGIRSGIVVGIMIESSIEMVIGILGVLKAGGAYLPIDKSYPTERIHYMLRDSNAQALLSVGSEQDSIVFSGERLDIKDERLYQGDTNNLRCGGSSLDLAYIMYSSGSTGEPKGILIEHRNVVRLVKNNKFIQFEDNDAILQTGSLVFDATTFEMWGALLNGLSLYLVSKEIILSADALEKEISSQSISIMWLTVALFNQLAQEKPAMFRNLRYLIVGGDALSAKHINLVKRNCKNVKILNGYGPTENTTFSTIFHIDKEYDTAIPIGKPISNSSAYIVDSYGELLPVGVYGELYLGGDGVARGYLNQPELTSEKFIQSPFVPGEKLYKSGDIARWLRDGNIEFAGRADHQVKIRGFRIEIDEIERKLLSHPSIKEALVLAKENEQNEKYLCAYVTVDGIMDKSKLKDYLKESLPGYMIPTYMIEIESFSLTTNGKVDKKSLPEATYLDLIHGDYVAPRTKTEEKLVAIWKEVLSAGEIGIDDNFFELGGNSLKASLMVNKIHKEMHKVMPLRSFFENATIRSISKHIDNGLNRTYKRIEAAEYKDYYKVSSVQKRMYTLQQMEPKSTTYNIPAVFELGGQIDKVRIENTFKKLIERHEALRTSFKTVNGEIVQNIQSEYTFGIAERKEDSKTIEEVINDFSRFFRLEEAPLCRVELVELAEKKYLLIDMHHIITDGLSMTILMKDFVRIYNGYDIEPLRIQYKDFAVWQHRFLQSEEMKELEDYWINKFAGELPVLSLPYDFDRPAIQSYDGKNINFLLDERTTEVLRGISKQTESSMFMVLLSAFYILLAKYSSQEDIIIGTPAAGRPHADLEPILGMFVNTLALRNNTSGSKSFTDFLKEVRESSLEAFENQSYQFEELLEKVNVEKDMSRNPLFDVMFTFISKEKDAELNLELDGLFMKSMSVDSTVSKFDLSLNMVEKEKSIECNFEYCTKLFQEQTVQRMVDHFNQILKNISEDCDVKISEIEITSIDEKDLILQQFNNTDAAYPQDKTIHQLVEEQAARVPDHIAVIFADKRLTYRELNERANQLAWVLRGRGVKPDQTVGIMVERSLEMMVGILAILKAGGAYLPIDPTHPSDRIQYILENSGTSLLLTNGTLPKNFMFSGEIMPLAESAFSFSNRENLPVLNTSRDLAYVIYTSGTTGQPKGVMIEHRSLVNRLNWMQKNYPLGEKDVILQKTPYTFDVSVWELLWWPIAGAQLVFLAPKEEREPDKILEAIERYRVTTMHFVPSMLHVFLDYLSVTGNGHKTASLKQVFTSGEALKSTHANTFHELVKDVKLVNLYGPTEATIDVTYFNCPPEEVSAIPIGKPIDNTKMYILDSNLRMVPVGVMGELCISGDGVARGYLNNEPLTAEKFVDHPYEPGTKLYRTGDLAKWLPDGNIEYLGRMDSQIKIRGFRIELGEVEKSLLTIEGIEDGVVVVKEKHDDKHLAAYYLGHATYSVEELRKKLKAFLPEYMIPTYFVKLDHMPMNANGKINRKALPEPNYEVSTRYEAPQNELQEKLVTIWSGVLKKETIGIHDNFFEIGGHSLKATVVTNKVYQVLQMDVSLRAFFDHPTIKELSDYLEGQTEHRYERIPVCAEQDVYETSSAQKRMYMVQQLEKGTVYNMPILFAIEGDIEPERIEETFQKLVNRHESLRTYFVDVDGEIVQKIHQDFSFTMGRRDGSGWTVEALMRDFVRPFELNQAPLFRAELAESDEAAYIMVDMHHIISDGVSIERLLTEFNEIYNGEELEPLRIQYKDFAAWQNTFLKSEELKKQEAYWIQQFSDDIPVLNLPYDYKRPVMQNFEGNERRFTFDEEQTEALRKIANETGSTMHMVLLSAFYILLSKYSGQEDIVIGTPVAGRPHAELQNIIGMFVNTLALRNEVKGEKRYLEFLEEVKQNSLLAYDNQSYQFEELIDKLQVNRDTSRHPLFDVMFTMNHREEVGVRKSEGLQLKPMLQSSNQSKFDLTLHVTENHRTLKGSFEYSTSLFKGETIGRMVQHFIEIVANICQNKDARLSEIEMMTEAEKHQVLHAFNDTKADYPREKTIVQLFEEQAARTPDRIAVKFENETLTYNELNQRSNQLARVLQKKGIKAESIVGLMVDKSLELVVGILGILKAGGAYLPIDPKFPEDRKEYMIKDSGLELLITSNEFNRAEKEAINIALEDEAIFSGPSGNLPLINKPEDLAYIIYTSGTTGNPKGVMVEHKNVVRLMINDQIQFDFSEKDVWTMFHSSSFDFSVWEMYGALLYGGKLVIVSDLVAKETIKYLSLLKDEKVTVLNQTPTAFYNLMKIELQYSSKDLCLRYIIFGGEALKPAMLDEWLKKYNETKLINMYGITETTVHVTFKEIGIKEVRDGASNIGKPIPTLTALVVDKNLTIQPIGVPGELCVGGAGVTRGYLNREQLTKDRFVQNPYFNNEKMYRSGDLVKLLSNGEIEYLGRIDHQVKIRGFRIELGEIENRLVSHEHIKEAVVLAKEDEQYQKYLCAYIVCQKNLDKSELKAYLKERLPEYMIPSYFMEMDMIPLTNNGKINRNALPEPDATGLISSDYEAPQTVIQKELVAVWKNVLGVGSIGIHDNFFDLGGHSLKATAVISEIHKVLHIEVPLKEIFMNPTIKELSRFIETSAEDPYEKIEPCMESEFYETSSAQKRMYTFQQVEKKSTAYNMPGIFELEGEVHHDQLENAFKQLVQRHEGLRTYFETVDGEIVQKVQPFQQFHLDYKMAQETDVTEMAKRFIQPFELDKAPLFRVEILENNSDKYLLIDMHHIISDGVSMSILIKELTKLYNGESLEPLRLQYKDFAYWQNAFLQSGGLDKQEAYWKNQFQGEVPVLHLPYDYERPSKQSFIGETIYFELDEKTTAELRNVAKEQGVTLHMLLLSAFNILLSKYSGQEDIVVGVPVAGRPHADLQNIMGMFVNTLAMRNLPRKEKVLREFIAEVKENSIQAYDNQSYQLEELIRAIHFKREQGRNPLFDVLFDMTNLDVHSDIKLNGGTLKPKMFESEIAKFDLTLVGLEREQNIEMCFEYSSMLFKKETMDRAIRDLKTIIYSITTNLDITLSQISIRTEEERELILQEEKSLDEIKNQEFSFTF